MSDVSRRYRSPVYKVIRGVAVSLVHLLFRVRVSGREYLPKDGGFLIASNHINVLDPFVIGAVVPRFVEFMAKDELFHVPVASGLIRYLGAFPVRRGANDKAALKRALEVPKRGGCLVIFPEGHRSRDGRIGKGLPGIALVARRSMCPVVPCAIVGTYGFRRTVMIRFGEPIVPSEDDTNETLLDKLMTQIRYLHSVSNLGS
ncbi:1-acyl-sn-glycerol-3-phosphate acyltransferase [Alicyclobacillus curvatus]|jgi:1-acyl-sn-glycerol-3-phosphate acyltransferase|nr:1-acyl-sn-glycerol-3-phosphate acyltransferase [Alicyclobacillus curvatus]